MKKFNKFLAAALAVILAMGAYSCELVNDRDMMVTPSTIDLAYSIDTPTPIRVSVNAGHDWYAQSTCEWITVTNITGTGFTIEIADAYMGYGADMRSGVVLVSSQIGQWPVIVNQERVPYSTYEEYLGTYRIQYAQYTNMGSGVFTPSGVTVDFMADLNDLRSQNISGLDYDRYRFDPIFIVPEPSNGSYSYVDLFFVPDAAALELSGIQYTGPIGLGYTLTSPTYYNPDDGYIWFFYGEEMRGTMNPETNVLEFPTVSPAGTSFYWGTYWSIGLMFTSYYYGDVTFTLAVPASPAPAPAPGAPIEGPVGELAVDIPAYFDAANVPAGISKDF